MARYVSLEQLYHAYFDYVSATRVFDGYKHNARMAQVIRKACDDVWDTAISCRRYNDVTSKQPLR